MVNKKKVLRFILFVILLKQLVKAAYYHKETLIDPKNKNKEQRNKCLKRMFRLSIGFKILQRFFKLLR